MNKLVAMQTFVRVAESGSFSAAAAQLGISVSAVAKTIARLEDELGTRLLERSTRRLALNDDGREYYARAVQILNEVEDAEASLRSGVRTPKGRVRIALPVLFARLTFLPRVAELTARYPELVLELRFDDRPGDLIEQGLDIAVMVGHLDDSRHVARVLNPLAHQGQINGGVVTGYGLALTEELVRRDGHVVNGHLGDYKLPAIADVPPLETVLVPSPGGAGPYEAKAIGELSNNGPPAAIANAIDAAVGVRLFDLPLTAERVYEGMKGR